MIHSRNVKDIDEARRLLQSLSAEGYNIFRGQRHPWPIRSSLFRLSENERVTADERVRAFLEWCSFHPRLGHYLEDPRQLLGIAQHYGLPTTLVDVTYSADVALFFALNGTAPPASSHSVVFAWRSSDLETLNQPTLVHLNIDNLWRLEAQKGLFLAFATDIELDESIDQYQVLLPQSQTFDEITVEDIYPSRKSLLETILDIYFYREQIYPTIEELASKVPIVAMKKWRSFRAAFRDRQIFIPSSKLDQIEHDWFAHSFRPHSDITRARRVPLHIDESTLHSNGRDAVVAAIDLFESHKAYPEFVINIFGDARKDQEISKAFNNVFDGIASLPYSTQNRKHCLNNCLLLLPSLRENNATLAREKILKAIFGKTIIVEFAPLGGMHNAGVVSKHDLEQAIDDQAMLSLRPFFKRYLRNRKLDFLCFCLEHLYAFKFSNFIDLFAAQVIPSQFASYLHEHLALLEDGGALWDVVSDPVSLGYFSISKYQFEYPFALEEKLDRTIVLFPEMTAADIRDEIISAESEVRATGEPFGLRLHGFSKDAREIWDIPKALRLLAVFARQGGISILEVFTLISFPGDVDQNRKKRGFLPLGAFEVWAILRHEMHALKHDVQGYLSKHRELFFADLAASNATLEKLVRQYTIWQSGTK